MILEPGRAAYPLPADFFDVYDHPHLETEPREQFPKGYSIVLMRLSPAEMNKLRKKEPEDTQPRACPHYYALMTREELVLHPPPDKAYVVHVRYFPQPKLW
jgi:hypothetical protein